MKDLKIIFSRDIFRRYFISCSLAYIGINIGLIGINWYIIDSTQSNAFLANYSIVTILTTILSSLFIGTLVDKINKSFLMKISCVFQAILVYGIFYIVNQNNNFTLIYGMAIVNSIGLALFGTASRSILTDIIDDKKLIISGNSILEVCMQIGAILAAGVTGILYDHLGIAVIINIMTISLVCSALVMKKTNSTKSNNRSITGKGFSIATKSNIFCIGLISFMPYIVTLLSNNVLPGYVSIHLDAPSSIYGISDMLYGIGALVAGLLIGTLNRIIHNNIEMKMFSLSFVILMLLYINDNMYFLFLLYFMFGLFNTSLKIIMNTIFMEFVPAAVYGRYYSLMNSIASVIQMGILSVLGYVLDLYGSALGYAILAMIMIIDGIIFKLIQKHIANPK